MGFKAIIIGGGLSGLGLAHCFHKAGIDYVVLERSADLFPQGGASIALWPNNVRILDQLDLLEGARKIDCNIKYKHNVRKDGTVLQKSNMMESVGIALGHDWMCFHRPRFHEHCLRSLPDWETHVLGGKELDTIETTAAGVKVTCKDGSVHEGSIVVGADGVNSAVRKHLARTLGDDKLAQPFTTSYRGLYGISDRTKGLEPATLCEMHGDKLTIQIIPGDGLTMYTVYQRLPSSTASSEPACKYDDAAKEAFARDVADVHVTPELRFRDLWDEVRWSYASGLEEGVAARWYGDRIVLVGDTVHKMTPNVGLGLNSGWQSAAVLTNGLRRLLSRDAEPSVEALNAVFAEYQATRKKNAADMEAISALYTRVVAWNNPFWKFADQYVTGLIGGDVALLGLLLVPLVKQGHTLDFLEEKNFKAGKTAWTRGRTTVEQAAAPPVKAAAADVKVADVEVAA